MSPISTTPHIDVTLNKFSQICVVLLSGLAFGFAQPIVTIIGAIALTLSAAVPSVSPFRLLYRYLLVPAHLLRPRVVEDDPAPHRFAQGIGAAFMIAASIVLTTTNVATIGWTLDLIVFALAGINYTVGFCAGCFVYYQLGKAGLMPHVRYTGSFHWRGV